MFAANVKARRIACGLTQQAMADAIGRDKETYYRYENGLIAPRLDTALRIAAVLGVRLSELLDER